MSESRHDQPAATPSGRDPKIRAGQGPGSEGLGASSSVPGPSHPGPDRRDRGARFVPASASSASDKRSGTSSGPSSAAYTLSHWSRFCWWLASALAPKDGSRFGPSIFGRSVKHDAK
jgi:hypothetical protein